MPIVKAAHAAGGRVKTKPDGGVFAPRRPLNPRRMFTFAKVGGPCSGARWRKLVPPRSQPAGVADDAFPAVGPVPGPAAAGAVPWRPGAPARPGAPRPTPAPPEPPA